MRIVCFSRYLPNLGGVEFFTQNICGELVRRGHDVTIVCTEPSAAADDTLEYDNAGSLRILRLDSWGWQRVPFICWSAHTRACLEEVVQMAPECALINMRFYGLSRLGARLMNRAGVRPVLLDHVSGHVTVSNPIASQLIIWQDFILTAWLKRFKIDFYGVSKDVSRWLGTFGIHSRGEINNGIDADSFRAESSGYDFRSEYGLRDDTVAVVFTGRLIEEKGVDTIVAAARMLADDDRFHFFVAGAGPMEELLTQADAELANFSFLGRLEHADLAALLLSSDVFCFPTRYNEGMPTVLLEAAVCGNALISTVCGGAEEIIATPDQGVRLQTPNAEEVVVHLRHLAEYPNELGALKSAAESYVRHNFTWAHAADQLLAAFEEAKHRGV